MKIASIIMTLMLSVAPSYAGEGKNASARHGVAKKRIAATVTAYTPSPRENGGRGRKSGTAIGTRIRPGIVAVSRDLLRSGWSFGSKVHIKGLGVFVIEDTMHQRHRRAVDVAVPNRTDAKKIGRMRDAEVTLLVGERRERNG